jgi:hypothetical protein
VAYPLIDHLQRLAFCAGLCRAGWQLGLHRRAISELQQAPLTLARSAESRSTVPS